MVVVGMRILIISNNYPMSASTGILAAFCVREMVLALSHAGAVVRVLAPDHVAADASQEASTVTRIPWGGGARTGLIGLKLGTPEGARHATSLLVNGMRETLRTLDDFRPDFTLAAWALPSGAFAWWGKKRRGVPYAVWCLGSDIHTWARKPLFGAATRRVLRAAALRYADGLQLARDAERIGGAPCGFLATSRCVGRAEVTPASLARGKRHFLFVGRWAPVKGLDLLIDAWGQLLHRRPEVPAVLHVVGQGETFADLLHTTSRSDALRGSLIVHGWTDEAQLAALYAAVDVVVIPSRRESIPVVFSEALAYGKRLLVTEVGDLGDLVRDYRLGIVVPPEDVTALSAMLERMVETEDPVDHDALLAARNLFDIGEGAKQLLHDISAVVRAPSVSGGSG